MTTSDQINPNRLFLLSSIALVVTSISFAIRAQLEPVFLSEYGLSATEIGLAFGPAFYGFTIAMVIFGPLVDIWGMKRILFVAFALHVIGIAGTILSRDLWSLFASTLAIGIANGSVEAACNPLVSAIYPKQKTKMLNLFHLWFPGGIVIGSVVAYFMLDTYSAPWQAFVALLFIPTAAYGFILVSSKFPVTERVASGVSTADMWKAIGKPLFLFIGFCMLLTASTELAVGQKINTLLQDANTQPMLVLALTTGIMAVGRAFAGPVVHRLSTTGMLLYSAIFAFIGIFFLSYAHGPMVYLAAVFFACGVCFFWPTMLSFVAEYIPDSGALGLSLMGGLGMFSVSIVLPIMGFFMDEGMDGATALRFMSILPAILIVAFSLLHFKIVKKKS
jgi:MFS family permease